MLTRRAADAAPEEMTWPCCLRSCDGEADRARGNGEILPCHGRCQRRNKEGEGVAGEQGSTLLRQSRSRRPLATSGTMRPRSRVVIRGDTMSCGRSPFPGLSSLSQQLHDWQSYEGPVKSIPPTTPAPPKSCIRRGVLRPSTFLTSLLGWWRGGKRRARPGSLADSEVQSAFLRTCNIFRSFPSAPAVLR